MRGGLGLVIWKTFLLQMNALVSLVIIIIIVISTGKCQFKRALMVLLCIQAFFKPATIMNTFLLLTLCFSQEIKRILCQRKITKQLFKFVFFIFHLQYLNRFGIKLSLKTLKIFYFVKALTFFMNQFINKRVNIGQKLIKYNQQELLQGLYRYKDHVFTSLFGVVKRNERGAYFVENNFPVQCFDIRVGDVVYGQVTKIREDEAFVNIIQINDFSLSKQIESTIRKEHVREKLIDQVVMVQSFKPNDIIKAKVISLGDSSRNLYLSTAAEDLGVLVAKNETTQQLMLPFDWTSMIDAKNGLQEKRKVAKPEL